MPVLTENPPEFSQITQSISDLASAGSICVARTLARREKKVAEWVNLRNDDPSFLEPRRIHYYLPMIQTRRALIPLLPGFIFISPAIPPICDLLRSTRDIFGFLFTDDQRRLQQELSLLASETPQSRATELFSRKTLAAGSPVRVLDGPFMGLEGIFISNPIHPHLDNGKLIVDLRLLGQTISVEISPEQVEPI